MGPGPIGRLDQGSDGLWGFSGQGRVKQTAGQEQNLSLRGNGEGFEKAFGALGHKDAGNTQTGVHCFLEQVRPLDSGQGTGVATECAKGVGQRTAELLEAGILLTLYNAKRHQRRTLER